MTGEDIRDTLATMLAGAVGGEPSHWLGLIGPVESLPIVQNIRSNWRISPSATGPELAAIITAAELVRAEHPYAAQLATRPIHRDRRRVPLM